MFVPEKPVILKIDKPHFCVKLHEDTLEVDIKEGAKKHLEDAVEANPILRETLGVLFQTLIPLDVALKDIKSVQVDDKGQLRIIIPLRRDLHIPLKREESEKLAERLNELIPLAKAKDAQRMSRLEGAEETRTRVERADE